MADSANQIVRGFGAIFHSKHVDRISLVMRAQNQLTVSNFHVLDGAGTAPGDGVHIAFAFSIRLERVVMTVDEDGGAGEEARVHAHAFAGVKPDEDKALPALAGSIDFGAETAQKCLLKLQYVLDVHAHDKRLSRSDRAIDLDDILKFVFGGGQNAGAFVDLDGIKEIKDRKMLHFEDFVHGLETESAFAIEKIRDMSLPETGLGGQAESAQFCLSDTLPQYLAEIILQSLEPHAISLSAPIAQCYCQCLDNSLKA